MKNHLLKNRRVILWLAAFWLIVAGLSEPAYAQPSSRNLDIYLLIGQSNMGGRGEITPEYADAIPGVWVLRGPDDWVEGKNPMNYYSTIQGGTLNKMNPGYGFSVKMRSLRPDRPIGIVSNARGATGLDQWMPGTNYYQQAVQRARLAMEYGTIKGVLWHQGEQDAKLIDPTHIDTYLDRITVMITALREDLGVPDLPFIAGQIYQKDCCNYKEFNDMMAEGFAGILPNTDLVYSNGLSSNGDNVHFNTESQRILGERYADKIYPFISDASCVIVPYLNINNAGWSQVSTATVEVGDDVWFGPQSDEFGASGGSWSYTGPNGQTHSGRSWNITNFQADQAGTYTVTNTDQNGCTSSLNYVITVAGSQLQGTFIMKNVSTGRVLDANPDGVIVMGPQGSTADRTWTLNPTSGGYVMIDNGEADRGPIAAYPSPASPLIWKAESFNATPYANREWLPVPVGGNVYKFQCRDAGRGYIAAGASGPINQLDGNATTAHWELISTTAARQAGDRPASKPTLVEDKLAPAFRVYPNPNAGVLNVELGSQETVDLYLYTMEGQLLLKKRYTGEPLQLELPSQRTGMYLLKSVSESGTVRLKKILRQ